MLTKGKHLWSCKRFLYICRRLSGWEVKVYDCKAVITDNNLTVGSAPEQLLREPATGLKLN